VDSINSKAHWSVSYTPSALGSKLGIGSVTSIVPTYSPTGNVIQLLVNSSDGKQRNYQKTACRTFLGLDSIHYTVSRQSDGSWLFVGGGWGHSVGMSQFGAYAMASVYGFNFKQIIGFYYTGVCLSTGAYLS